MVCVKLKAFTYENGFIILLIHCIAYQWLMPHFLLDLA